MDVKTKAMMVQLGGGVIKKGLMVAGTALLGKGVLSDSSQVQNFVSIGMVLVGAGWSFWDEYGRAIVTAQLEVLKAKSLAQAAKMKTAGVAPPTATEIAAQHPTLTTAEVTKAITPAIILAVLLSAMAFPQPADAQAPIPKPRILEKIETDIEAAKNRTQEVVTGKPAPGTPLPCDFKMVIKLTPDNLLGALKQCIAVKLVSDTERALNSALAFGTTGKGDADAINCLTPTLEIFKAGVPTPAVPEIPAILNADGSVKTPAVPAVPEQDPGPILLYQKYREFTISGALTSCQAWFNGPINATMAAGIAGAGTIVGAAALIAPK
jgi:hypothetical protein